MTTSTAIATVIDHQLAQSILDKLGYTLEELDVFGDRGWENNEISHQLYYGSIDNAGTILGYVRVENGIYYSTDNNYRTPQEAALDLIPSHLVAKTIGQIEESRATMPAYF
jgi:hypothetical protein